MWVMRVIGFLYVLAGLWCAIMTQVAAQSLGYQLIGDTGLAEFFTVYGGLEVGIGLAMVLTTMRLKWYAGGLMFAVVIAWSLPIFRILSLILFAPEIGAWVYLLLELVLAIALSLVLYRSTISVSE